ncbi:MAG: hypothetical protein M3327_07010, partial [Actinomycetota bacterium]|nr:hypothetical protein [Actinomycetota bacterium]
MDGLLDWYLVGLAVGLGLAAGIAGVPRDANRTLAVTVVVLAAAGAGVIAALATGWAVVGALVGVG